MLVAGVLALAGAGVAGYLTAVQAGAIERAWDPIFGDGTDQVIGSSVANVLPFPDALLGVLAYLAEVVLLVLVARTTGQVARWARRLLETGAVAFGLAGAALVLLQALVVHAWCSWCLLSAGLSWAILALTIGVSRGGSPAPHRSPRSA